MKLTFLYPQFLWLLPFTFLPWIIHLLSRNKFIRIEFSETKYLKLAIQRSWRLQRIRQYLLLILRCLIILLLTLLFTRPSLSISPLRQTSANTKESLTYIFFLLDNSFSMHALTSRGIPVGTQAKQVVTNIIRKLRHSERVSILSFADRIKPLVENFSTDYDWAVQGLDKYELSYRPNKLSSILPDLTTRINNLPGEVNKLVFILSDFTKSGWELPSLSSVTYNAADPSVKFIFLDLNDGKRNNYGWQTISPPLRVTPGETVSYQLTVRNWGGTNYSKIVNKLSTLSPLQVQDSGLIDIPAGLSVNKVLMANFMLPGEYSGFVTLTPDELSVDNRIFFTTRVDAPDNILIIDGEPGFTRVQSEIYYLQLALNPELKTKRYNLTTRRELNLTEQDCKENKIIFLANLSLTDTPEYIKNINLLKQFRNNGGHIIITLGRNTNPEIYQTLVNDFLPGTINRSREETVTLGAFNPAHPLAQIFSETSTIAKVVFKPNFNVVPKKDAIVVATYQNGTPLLLESTSSNPAGKVILYTSTLDRDSNNFPANPSYPIFWQGLVNYLLRGESKSITDEYIVGKPIRFVYANPKIIQHLHITDENQQILNCYWLDQPNFTGIETSPVEKPGIYRLTKTADFVNDKLIPSYIAVNVDLNSGEPDLTAIDKTQLKKIFPANLSFYLSGKDDTVNEILKLLYGKEITNTILVFCLIVFTVENFIAARPLSKKS